MITKLELIPRYEEQPVNVISPDGKPSISTEKVLIGYTYPSLEVMMDKINEIIDYLNKSNQPQEVQTDTPTIDNFPWGEYKKCRVKLDYARRKIGCNWEEFLQTPRVELRLLGLGKRSLEAVDALRIHLNISARRI